jgi:hypothetical protein
VSLGVRKSFRVSLTRKSPRSSVYLFGQRLFPLLKTKKNSTPVRVCAHWVLSRSHSLLIAVCLELFCIFHFVIYVFSLRYRSCLVSYKLACVRIFGAEKRFSGLDEMMSRPTGIGSFDINRLGLVVMESKPRSMRLASSLLEQVTQIINETHIFAKIFRDLFSRFLSRVRLV